MGGKDISLEKASLAPLPRISFRVGVVGHRRDRLEDALLPELSRQLHDLLTTIRKTVSGVHPLQASQLPPVLRMITSLAEGADTLAAEAAISLGFDLQVPLPFSESEYESTFDHPASAAGFRALLKKASSVYRINSDITSPEMGFRFAGETVVNQSDLLLAVWDGKNPHGIGGTGETVTRALDLGLPVLHISSEEPGRLRWLDESGVHEHAVHQLREYLRNLQRFDSEAEDRIDQNATNRTANHRSSWSISEVYLRASFPKAPVRTAYVFTRLIAERRIAFPKAPVKDDPVTEIESPELKPYFLWSDALAVYYGELSRSAGLWIQFSTSFAVLSSLCLVLVEHSTSPLLRAYRKQTLQILSSVEFVSIVIVILIFFSARKFRWHARWLCFRSVAEQIRSLDLLHPLGLALPRLRGFFDQDELSEEEVFSAYLVQSIARQLGLAASSIDQKFLERRFDRMLEAVHLQTNFHKAFSERHETAERLLTMGSMLLFAAAGAIAIIDLLASFGWLGLGMEAPGIAFSSALAVLLPALAALAAGLATQGELKRLAHRSKRMERRLGSIRKRLLTKKRYDLKAIVSAAMEIAEVFLSEVRQWQNLVSAKAPTIG